MFSIYFTSTKHPATGKHCGIEDPKGTNCAPMNCRLAFLELRSAMHEFVVSLIS